MGSFNEAEKIVLLFDNYLSDSQKLHTSFKTAGRNCLAAVIEDDGFLPEDVMSVFGYFLGEFSKSEQIPGKPIAFYQVKVPMHWEIIGQNANGKIMDLNKERGRIFYAAPSHKRMVKAVDWYDEKGVVRSTDHYNKYGALYARTIFNAKGQKVNKTYFSSTGKEIIMENYVTKNIILNESDEVKVFRGRTDFVCHFFEKAGLAQYRIFFNTLSTSFFVSQNLKKEGKQDVLFWQENVGKEIPGNMRFILDGKAAHTAQIMVQKRDAYDKLIELGAPSGMLHKLGYVYSFKKENRNKHEVLICTNSDNIEQCSKLVEALPEMHFYIVALTEMSSKLMNFDSYENVTLYPNVKLDVVDELFETCDYYLDVNHGTEILAAVEKAFLHNHLILAFNETLHESKYVSPKHVFPASRVESLIECMKAVISDKAMLDEHLKMQHAHALLETAEKYLQI